jgi:hypothetical protein
VKAGGSRPEPTPEEREAQRRADRLRDNELQKIYGLSDADFAWVKGAQDFPKAFSGDKTGRWPHERLVPVRSREKTAAWFAQARRIIGVK